MEIIRKRVRKAYGVFNPSTGPADVGEMGDVADAMESGDVADVGERADSAERPATAVPTADICGETASTGKHVPDMSIIALLERTPLCVAAYILCKEDDIPVQVTGLELQKRFMEIRIKEVPAWTFAGAYIDHCSAKTLPTVRPGFKALIENKEQYDLVLCKSISKVGEDYNHISPSRWHDFISHLGSDCNTVGNTLDELSKRGIYFYFEIEQLYTGDASWKVMWAMHKALARQECVWRYSAMKTPSKQDGRRRRRASTKRTGKWQEEGAEERM